MADVNTGLVIGIVVAAVVVLVALLALGLVLRKRRQISLRDDSALSSGGSAELDKSGGYQASSGFTFSQGPSATAEKVAEPGATAAPTQPPQAPADDTSVVAEPDTQPEPEQLPEPIAQPEPEPEVQPEPEPETQPEPEKDAQSEKDAQPEAEAQLESKTEALPEPAPETHPKSETQPAAEAQPEPEASQPDAEPAGPRDEIAPTDGRLEKLRGRLSRSQNAVGQSVLGLLGAGDLDEESWEEIEDTLLMADLGSATTGRVVERLRSELASRSVRTAAEVRALLREVLIDALSPTWDRSIRALPHSDHPSVLLVVGVNGTGKTTTTGKLARVLVADGRRVLLGAADTFRAAAADQLQTWGERVGASVVRGKEQADPASVAFDAVVAGTSEGVDVVMIDTAGRLHTKTGLMDELGKVKRVVEKKAKVDEVLLVLDATIGQNGLAQARVFAEVVDITGVVLTKLDGTAKGGIVFHVQHELGVPVKLVGLGEGADDLAPFEPAAFVDALLG